MYRNKYRQQRENKIIRQIQCTVASCQRRLTPILLATQRATIIQKKFQKINRIIYNEQGLKNLEILN